MPGDAYQPKLIVGEGAEYYPSSSGYAIQLLNASGTRLWGLTAAGVVTAAGAAETVTFIPNTDAAWVWNDGTTEYFELDTRTTVTGVNVYSFGAAGPTIASATGDTFNVVNIPAITVTLTGTTTVTALDGISLDISAPTVTDTMAVTVTTVSALRVALPVAAGMVTATNIFTAHFLGAIRVDGNINVAAQATTVVGIANTDAALLITDGTAEYYEIDTRTTVTGVVAHNLQAAAPTIASATGDTYNLVQIGALTVTLTGGTLVTALDGAMLNIAAVTVTDTMAETVTTVSALFVAAPVAAGMITITNNVAIHEVGGTLHGTAGTTTGKSLYAGSASGIVTVTVAATAGTWTLTLPAAVAGMAGYQLTDAAANGVATWAAAGSKRELKNILGEIKDYAASLRDVIETPVYAFHYKQGLGTGDTETEYVGVMADEAPWAMHYQGGIINPVNTLGKLMLAIKGLDQRMALAGI